MAREAIEKLIDDLDGSEAVETITFGLDGASYEIDLNKKNAAALRKALGPSWRRPAAARERRPRLAAGGRGQEQAGARGYDIVQLREWAGTNGVQLPARGRIPQATVEQYKAAGGKSSGHAL